MLEELTPREFEGWCQILLERYYSCTVELTGYVGDEGRDLIVHHPSALIIVECKHYPNSSVGRPIVQKLDSAIRTANAQKGIVLTTGKISKEAQEYAKKIKGVEIELVDGVKLAHFASKVGLLSSDSQAGNYSNFAIKTIADTDFPQISFSSIFTHKRYNVGQGYKSPIAIGRKTAYRGYYVGVFSAHGKVNTARGMKQAFWEDKVWLTHDGKICGIGQPPNFNPDAELIFLGDALQKTPGDAPPPSIQPHVAANNMKQFLISSQSEIVTYVGRNNVRYRKQIRPSSSSTQVNDVRLVYVPKHEITIRAGGIAHTGEIFELGNKFTVKAYTLSECCVCGRSTKPDSQIFCAICHKPAHTNRFLTPDSFHCAKCNATVCRTHAVQRGKYVLCRRCSPNKGKPLKARWLSHLLIGAIPTLALIAMIVVLLVLGSFVAPSEITSGPVSIVEMILLAWLMITIFAWVPFLYVITSWNFRIKGEILVYPIVLGMNSSTITGV